MRIITVILLLFGLSVSAQRIQPKIAVDYFTNKYDLKFDNPNTNDVFTVQQGNFRTRIGAELSYKKASIYFDQHLYMNKVGSQFDPTEAYWYAGAKYKWKFIDFKFEHLCIHPINTYSNQYRSRYYGGYNMISISYGY